MPFIVSLINASAVVEVDETTAQIEVFNFGTSRYATEDEINELIGKQDAENFSLSLASNDGVEKDNSISNADKPINDKKSLSNRNRRR